MQIGIHCHQKNTYRVQSNINFARLNRVTFALTGRCLGMSSGSSSEGVGNTLKGVLVELFRLILEGAFTGVGAEAAAAVDFLFLGDDRAGCS
jgi:hypothetical protein